MRHNNRMELRDILTRITKCQERLGLSDNALSQRAGMSRDGIRNWRRRLDAGEDAAGATIGALSGIAKVLGVSETWLIHGLGDGPEGENNVAVAGRVGAGAEVDLEDAYTKGDGLYHVACPPQLSPSGIVAVEVTGDSMSPAYPPGTVLFYGRDTLGVPTEAIGRICVCEDVDGRAWVKHLKTGSSEGTFSLISINPEAENRHGVRLKWAAPVKLALPPEYVKRITI